MHEFYFDDFDSVTWDYVEDLLDSGEYGDFEDDDPDSYLEFDMTYNPFDIGEDEHQAFGAVRRFLLESGVDEDDEAVKIFLTDRED
jgi:hypothetical protein